MTPDGWRLLRLVDVLEEPIRNGYSPVCPNEVTGKWILSLGAVTHEGFNPKALKSAPLDDPQVDTAVLRPGDIIVSRSNTRERVGLAGLYEGTPSPCTYPDLLMRVRLAPSAVPEFVIFGLLSKSGREYFQRTARGTSGSMLKIDRTILEGFPLHLPPLPEQRKISAILSSVDDAIEGTQAVIDQLGVVKKAMMAELLTRGLPGRHTRFKQTEIGEVPEEWRVGTVADFLHLQRGFDITQKLTRPGEVPVISSGGISYFHSEPKCPAPGVVTGRKGKLGDVFFVETSYWPHDTTLWVSDFRANAPRFVAWFLRHLELEKLDSATAVPTLNRNNVHPLPAAFPPFAEQEIIAEVLDSHVSSIESTATELEGMRKLKSSLMSVLLTGEVRVKPEGAQ